MSDIEPTERNDRAIWAVILVMAVSVMAFAVSHAETNLPVVCTDASKLGQQVNKCPSTSQQFTAAGDASLVRNCPNTNCTNASADNILRKFSEVSATSYVEVCTVE